MGDNLITFVLLACYWMQMENRLKHRHSIADASQCSPGYYNTEYTSPMRLGHFKPWCTSPNVVCCSATYRRWFLATKHRKIIPMHALQFFSIPRCLGEAWRLLAYVADHSPNYCWRMVALPWRCQNWGIT